MAEKRISLDLSRAEAEQALYCVEEIEEREGVRPSDLRASLVTLLREALGLDHV